MEFSALSAVIGALMHEENRSNVAETPGIISA